MRTKELKGEGINYSILTKLIQEGYVERIKHGFYQWQDDRAFSEVVQLKCLFPEAIICSYSALVLYGYSDRTVDKWHIAVDNRSSRTKYRADHLKVKVHFIDEKRLNVGKSHIVLDGETVQIYDRERVICDCLRHMETMDSEIFQSALKGYIRDPEKNVNNLMVYAKCLGVEKKARHLIVKWSPCQGQLIKKPCNLN